MSIQKPLVSVAMITYGHEAYIKQSIEGVLMQDCDFEVELIISNDCSPDRTDKVINDIIENHPRAHWIKYFKHEQNKGVAKNFAWVLQEGSGEYIAICEGDDYWTDPLKLQKQVGFLEKNCEFSMACNSSSEIDEKGHEYNIAKRKEDIIHLATVLKEGWFIRTASIVFRKEAIKEGFPDFFFKAYSTDYILQVMLLKTGLCKYFPEVMSAYRHHQGGISQANKKLQFERWVTKIQLLYILNDFTERKFNKEVIHHQRGIARTISFYLYRYPTLINGIGLKNYIKHGNLGLFFLELSRRLVNRFYRLKLPNI